ncbi:MAG: protein phosphatase 2C domain-containing protein [Anaerolineales bacterium]|nr:protein phosphatase 2C domain-containing protein [Anaerolineales bacterium]
MASLIEVIKSFFKSKATPTGEIERPQRPVVTVPDDVRQIIIGTGQSTGIERSHNEDALLVINSSATGDPSPPNFGLFVVADGMGGHRAGEVASAVSIRTVARTVTEQTIVQMLGADGENEMKPLQDLLRGAIEQANQAVVEQVPGGGTTLTAVVMLGQQITIGHVGDSRAYLLQDGHTEVLTRDHSLVERLRELGQLTAEEAAVHPQRNVLYRAIGQGANLEVDVSSMPTPRGGYLMVCSDGLWGVLGDERMKAIIDVAPSPQIACEKLVDAANAAGGPDNITVILVRFPSD